MFAVFGVVAAKLLPADKNVRVLGVPNRWALARRGLIRDRLGSDRFTETDVTVTDGTMTIARLGITLRRS